MDYFAGYILESRQNVLSHHSCITLGCSVLSCFVLSRSMLSWHALYHPGLLSVTMSFRALSCSGPSCFSRCHHGLSFVTLVCHVSPCCILLQIFCVTLRRLVAPLITLLRYFLLCAGMYPMSPWFLNYHPVSPSYILYYPTSAGRILHHPFTFSHALSCLVSPCFVLSHPIYSFTPFVILFRPLTFCITLSQPLTFYFAS